MNSEIRRRNGNAIVIGGSMAGLLASRVLAEYYQTVTILERDTLGTNRENRRGVPQGRHTHGLLAGGRYALEALFPGISDQLIAKGALSADIIGDSIWFVEGACHTRFSSGLMGLLMSRPCLESQVRERVRELPNVRFREGCTVTGPLTSADQSRVCGVHTADGTLAADLVVDTSGRGSHTPQWLEAMGYAKPEEQRVEVALAYTTRCFRRTSAQWSAGAAIIVPPTPEGKIGGVCLAQEHGRWTVTLISHFGPAAPSDIEGFRDFARRLPAPYIHDFLREAEAVGEPAETRFPASIRRRYERLSRFPGGYLAMGDALCSFNPIYGQGMTVAAMQAVELQALLRHGSEDIARRFFARASKVIDIPWSMAVGNDLRMTETSGQRTFATKAINAYVSKVHKAAHRDAVVALAFHRVANLLASPSALMRAGIASRVLWSALRQAGPRKMDVGKPLPRTLTKYKICDG